MTPKELLNIVKEGESETVEFKSNFNNETIITLCAFANTKGGMVIIGVSDSGDIKGVLINQESVKNWINEIKLKTEPSIIPDAQTFTLNNKTVIALSVHEFPIKPISVRGRFYACKNNSNHLLRLDEINDFITFHYKHHGIVTITKVLV
ncbi:hypothetical protein ES708_24085 [subsurface metagenome]